MKDKRFYIVLISFFVVGFGSIFLYRQQLEGRSLEFEDYEILAIEKRVSKLYNKDKSDISDDITKELKELEVLFNDLKTGELNYRNKKRNKVKAVALKMYQKPLTLSRAFIFF